MIQILLNLAVNAFQCAPLPHRVEVSGEVLRAPLDLNEIQGRPARPAANIESMDNTAPLVVFRVSDMKKMSAIYRDRSLDIQCYIWPGKSHLDGFKLNGEGGVNVYQGFYFYRNGRLLQVGGWNQVFVADREHQLARVAIDIDDSWAGHLRMNPEKSSVTMDADFQDAIGKATAEDGKTFWIFLDDAREVYKRSRKRNAKRPKMITPGKGIHPALRHALDDELEYLPDEDPFDIRWKPIPGETFLEVDRERRTLWLNKRYRSLFTGDSYGSLNDAPLLKGLLYLLVQEVFKGSYLGPRDKDSIDLWQQVLTAAARAEFQ